MDDSSLMSTSGSIWDSQGSVLLGTARPSIYDEFICWLAGHAWPQEGFQFWLLAVQRMSGIEQVHASGQA